MFLEFFDWFCKCLGSVFEVMKKFVLFEGFSYWNLCLALMAIPIIMKLIHFIMAIEDEEVYYDQPSSSNYISQYDGYVPRHAKRKKRG